MMATIRMLLAILASALALPAHAQPALSLFEAVYTISFSIAKGEATVSLRTTGDGEYIYDSVTEPKGFLGVFVRGYIRETSRFTVQDGRLMPLHYERVDTISSDERDLQISFNWREKVAVTTFGETREEVPLTKACIDPGLLPIVVMHDLSNGTRAGPYTLVERGRLEQVDVETEGEEQLATKAGRYATTRLVHKAPDSNRITRLWAAPALGQLMVQMAQYKGDKERAKLTLKSVQFVVEGAD